MTRLRAAVRRLRSERGSAEVFAFILTFPLLLGLIFFAWISMSYRDALRLPINQVVNSYTQQFAAYGTNTPPEYASFYGTGTTITSRMTQTLQGLGSVQKVNSVTCGALVTGGTINATAVIYANTPVGCSVNVTIASWPYATVLPVTKVLFGGDYRVFSTAFTDKGRNVNIQ